LFLATLFIAVSLTLAALFNGGHTAKNASSAIARNASQEPSLSVQLSKTNVDKPNLVVPAASASSEPRPSTIRTVSAAGAAPQPVGASQNSPGIPQEGGPTTIGAPYLPQNAIASQGPAAPSETRATATSQPRNSDLAIQQKVISQQQLLSVLSKE